MISEKLLVLQADAGITNKVRKTTAMVWTFAANWLKKCGQEDIEDGDQRNKQENRKRSGRRMWFARLRKHNASNCAKKGARTADNKVGRYCYLAWGLARLLSSFLFPSWRSSFYRTPLLSCCYIL